MVRILDSFFFVYTSISLNRNKNKATTSLVNRKCKTYGKKDVIFMLDTAGSTADKVGISYFGSGDYRRIWFIFPALRTSHIQ